MLKSLAKNNFEAWMERRNEEASEKAGTEVLNWELWEANKLSATQKRTLVTHVFGEAWASICSPKYRWARKAAFVRTGLLMTLSGKGDDCVFFEGRKD